MSKRLARAAAKLFVADYLKASDMPDWAEVFLPEADDQDEFMNELNRISARVLATISPLMLTRLRDIESEHATLNKHAA